MNGTSQESVSGFSFAHYYEGKASKPHMKRSTVAAIQKRTFKILDGITDGIVVAILVFMMVCGAYAVWDNHILENTASSAAWQPYKPKVPSDTQSFEELQAMNPDVIGWLDIYGTKVDYPLLYSTQKDKYLSMNPKGEYSMTGSLFLDPESTPDFTDFNTIIYGHHMEANAMFGGLDYFKGKDYFDEHRYGKLYYNGREWGLDILCIFTTDAYDFDIYNPHITREETKTKYIERMLSLAVQSREDQPALEDTGRFLILSTCATASTNERTLIAARVTDSVPEDTFISWPNTGTGVDLEWTIFGIVWYVWLFIIMTILCAVGLALLTYHDRTRKRARKFQKVSDALKEIEKLDRKNHKGNKP